MVADRLEHGCWQFWTLGSLNRVADGVKRATVRLLDRLTICPSLPTYSRITLQTNYASRRIIHPYVCSIKRAIVTEWWNNKIEQRCYNNHELGCCIKSGFVCSNIREQPLSIRQAVYNMLKHDWTILSFYQSCSIMLTVFWQGCWATNNPVIDCDISTRVGYQFIDLLDSQDYI